MAQSDRVDNGTYTIQSMKRLNNSVNGIPRYRMGIVAEDGTVSHHRTTSNGSVNFEITSMMEGSRFEVAFDRYGNVESLIRL